MKRKAMLFINHVFGNKKLLTLVLTAVLALVVAGALIMMGPDKESADNTQSSGYPAASDNSLVTKQDTDTKEQPGAQTMPSSTNERTFKFIDTSNWKQVSAKDGSYMLKFGPSETTGYCTGDSSTTMLGMIYMDQSGEYECSGVGSALESTSPMLTRVAVGAAETDKARPADTQVTAVSLSDGMPALLYEYSTTINDKSYNHRQYVVAKNGKDYVAHLMWEQSYDLYGGTNITPEYFDTIVQKTWLIR